jgi:hypothetical protein
MGEAGGAGREDTLWSRRPRCVMILGWLGMTILRIVTPPEKLSDVHHRGLP